MSDVRQQIEELVRDNKIVLFMKGTKSFPQCGFSSRSVEVFKRCGVTFKDVNVLADPGLRQGIKDYSNWPTIPQIYVDGSFLGGSDILLEMYETGELHKVLGLTPPVDAASVPKITLSPAAIAAFTSARATADATDVLRLDVTPAFAHDLYFGPKADGDFVVDAGGLTLHVAKAFGARANGVRIDFVTGPDGAGFKIDNPNEAPKVKNLSAKDLAAMIASGAKITLLDVRGEKERDVAKLPSAVPLDAEGQARLATLSKDACIVLHCHHGVRSRTAAERLLGEGFTNVYSLTGGIDMWSLDVDSSVPRY
ncbi:MAG: Grx4 family monothiol glutaredoxin [Myxococcales bacterium]|nr:Grx4 family monothiol glutaredoxin [Myxococcales bacterium]